MNANWSFTWPCPTCQRDRQFLVTEGPVNRPNGTKRKLPHKVWGRCEYCTRLIEIGDQHRERRWL